MSEIKRLLRVAAQRNRTDEYRILRVRMLKSDVDALRAQLADDSIASTVLFEAVIRGYLNRHPAVLAMIDQWRRDESKGDRDIKPLSRRELDSIYAELGGGTIDEDG